MKSPFKFLDSFTKEDKDIFFGRERETEELYQKVFESKILLVYGVSGTGKSSLIHCGLANKFQDSDWLPINIRRGANMNESLKKAVSKLSIAEVKEGKSLTKQLKNLYLDHFKPIYLIFDQFEELFIFGSKAEKEEFIQNIKKIVDSEIQCKFLFVIREEYLAGITEFEKEIPTFLQNRIRIEKMTRTNAVQCIEGPCKVHDITVEEGFSDALLEKLSPGSTDVELTYMQVYLDKIFRESGGENFNQSILDKLGDVKDLLGSFLEEQIATLDDPDSALAILKSFVSVKGTKRQITEEEINEHCKTIGKNVELETFKKQIAHFVNIRILRDKDESGRYELRHDALAAKIYEKITLVEKELMEIRQFIENAYDNFKKRSILLSSEDLAYISEKENLLILSDDLKQFINESKQQQKKQQRTTKYIVFVCSILLLLLITVIVNYFLSKVLEVGVQQESNRLQYDIANPVERFQKAHKMYELDPMVETKRACYQAFFDAFDSDTSQNKSSFALKYTWKPEPHDTVIEKAVFSPDSKALICLGADDDIIVYENFGRLKRIIHKPGINLVDFKVSDDFMYIAVNSMDSIYILSLNGNSLFSTSLFSPFSGSNSYCFDPACKFISIINKEDKVSLYDFSGKMIQTLTGHADQVNCIDIAFDSKHIVTASADRTVMVWNVMENGQYHCDSGFTCHKDTIWSACFSKNGKYFLTACADGNNKVISIKGKETFELLEHEKSRHLLYFESRKQRQAWFIGDERVIVQEIYINSVSERSEINTLVDNTSSWGEYKYICSSLCDYANRDNRIYNCLKISEIDIDQNNSLIVLYEEGQNHCTLCNFSITKEPLMRIEGSKPRFSQDGAYVLSLIENEIVITPVCVTEFANIINPTQN